MGRDWQLDGYSLSRARSMRVHLPAAVRRNVESGSEIRALLECVGEYHVGEQINRCGRLCAFTRSPCDAGTTLAAPRNALAGSAVGR